MLSIHKQVFALFFLCSSQLLLAQTDVAQIKIGDNAALYYYQALLTYGEPNSELAAKLVTFRSGETEVDKDIRFYLYANRWTIARLEKAVSMPVCDWGYDFEAGWEEPIPAMPMTKSFARLLTDHSLARAQSGDISVALSSALAIYQVANDVVTLPLVSFMTACSVRTTGDRTLTALISKYVLSSQQLENLEKKLTQIDGRLLPFSQVVAGEASYMKKSWDYQMANLIDVAAQDSKRQDAVESILATHDVNALYLGFDIYSKYMEDAQDILKKDMQYNDTYKALEEITTQIRTNSVTEAGLVAQSAVGIGLQSIYDLSMRTRNSTNALRAAIAVYIYHTQNNSLPDEIPGNAPGDLFSGKPFEYIKTPDGFTLRTPARGIDSRMHEYNFKLPSKSAQQ